MLRKLIALVAAVLFAAAVAVAALAASGGGAVAMHFPVHHPRAAVVAGPDMHYHG